MKNIKSILRDIYKIDPSLKKSEKEIIALLEALIQVKPDIKPNKEFVRELREQLSQKAETGATKKAASAEAETSNWLQNLIYALGGGALTAVLALAVLGINPTGDSIFKSRINDLGKNAFQLETLVPIDGGVANSARPQSGGGGMESSLDAKIDSRMIMPENMTKVVYSFNGQFPLPEEDELPLYKIKTSEVNDGQLVGLVKKLDFSLINLKAMQNAKVQNISIVEDRKDGYAFYIDLENGNISINQNWRQWENPYDKCQGDQACYDNLRIKPSDIPNDERLISITDAFLKDYGIDVSRHGAPEVNRNWERNIATAERPEDIYYPEQVNVTYPQLLDGKFVMEGPESKAGISVTVDVRRNLVTSVWGMRAMSYDRSMYEAEKDGNRLAAWVKEGGWQNGYYGNGSKVVNVEVENPELVYMKVYQYKDGTSSEVLVPAYLMTLVEGDLAPNNFYYHTQILVPAVKGIDELREGGPVIMPLEGDPVINPAVRDLPAEADSEEVKPEEAKPEEEALMMIEEK